MKAIIADKIFIEGNMYRQNGEFVSGRIDEIEFWFGTTGDGAFRAVQFDDCRPALDRAAVDKLGWEIYVDRVTAINIAMGLEPSKAHAWALEAANDAVGDED